MNLTAVRVIIFFSFLLLAKGLTAQTLFLTVADQLDLHRISHVEVIFHHEDGSHFASSQTDVKGRVILHDNLLQAASISLSHEEYIRKSLSMVELTQMNYRIFLEPNLYEFSEVVFTANKYRENEEDIPYQIDVISAREVEFRNPQTTADMLLQEGNVFVQKSQMGGGSPNIRGFEANKVLLVIDGVRMNNAIYRSGHLQNIITIDPDIIDRSEVMFGPGSVMYGSDALGGVMHFYTKSPEISSTGKTTIKTNSSVRFGSANLEKRVHGDVNIGFEKMAFLTSLSVSDFGDLRVGDRRPEEYPDFGKRLTYIQRINDTDQLRENRDPNIQRFTAYTQYDFMQKMLLVPSDRISHAINLQISSSTNIPRYDRLVQTRGGNLRYADWYYGPQERLLASYQVRLHADRGFYDQLNIITAYQDIEESRNSREVGDDLIDRRIENVKVASLNLDANKVLQNEHELAYGIEVAYNLVGSSAFSENITDGTTLPLDTRYPDGGSEMTTLAGYFTHRWEITDHVMLTDGLRYSNVSLVSRFDNQDFFPFGFQAIENNSGALSGNIGLVVKTARDWRFSLLGSTGFRAPNLDDVAKVFDSQPGNVVVPNPDLKPEFTYNGELSVSKKFGRHVKAEVTGFYTLYDDAIVVRDFSLEGKDSILYSGVLSRVQANINAGRAFITGFNFGVHAGFKHWSLEHTLTYTYGRDVTNDLPMDHIPPLFGRGAVSGHIKRFKVEGSIFYNGAKPVELFSPRDLGDLPFATPEGTLAWWTLNLKTSYAVSEKINIHAGIENILDRHYRPYSSRISAPGRNIYFSIKTSL